MRNQKTIRQNTIRRMRPHRRTGKYASLLLLTMSLAATAQPSGIPVLKQQLAQTRADTTRSRLLCKLGELYADVNLDSCVFYLNQSLQLAQHARDSVGMAQAMYQLGNTHVYVTKDEGKAINWLKQALAIALASNNYACLANCYRLLSIVAVHQHIGNPDELLAKALRYAEQTNDWQVQTDAYATFGQYKYQVGNYEQATYGFRQAMVACKSHDLQAWYSFGLDVCEVLKTEGKDDSLQAFARQLATIQKQLPVRLGNFVYDNDQARLAIYQKKYPEAETYLLTGLAIQKKRPKPDTLQLSYYYENLVEVYTRQKDYQKAFEATKEQASIRLTLQRVRQTRDAKLQMTQQQAAFDLQERDNQIKLLDARQQQQQLLLAGAALVAVLLVGFMLIQRRNQKRIEQQRTQLVQLNTTKDKLFAILAHDLRSPVSALSNFLALHNWGMLPKAEFDQSVNILTERLVQVQTLLDNTLNWALSHMGGMRPQLKSVAVAPIVAEQVTMLQYVAASKQISVSWDIPPQAMLVVDAEQVVIMIRNLLQNALKFTPVGGSVLISWQQQNAIGQLVIADTGIGMNSEQLDGLFRLGKQTSRSGTAHEPGTGLGLILVKDLAEANKGNVSVDSQEGKGSTFRLLFPVPSEIVLPS